MAFTVAEVQAHLATLKDLLQEVGPVISQALTELVLQKGGATDRESALRFLAGKLMASVTSEENPTAAAQQGDKEAVLLPATIQAAVAAQAEPEALLPAAASRPHSSWGAPEQPASSGPQSEPSGAEDQQHTDSEAAAEEGALVEAVSSGAPEEDVVTAADVLATPPPEQAEAEEQDEAEDQASPAAAVAKPVAEASAAQPVMHSDAAEVEQGEGADEGPLHDAVLHTPETAVSGEVAEADVDAEECAATPPPAAELVEDESSGNEPEEDGAAAVDVGDVPEADESEAAD